MLGDGHKLQEGSVVVIIGGGPAGTSCAVKLKREARKKGVDIRIIIYECKDFCSIDNQCMGVLSPPLLNILDNELGISLPPHLVRSEISNYVLHVCTKSVLLNDSKSSQITTVVKRGEFDNFMLEYARSCGIEIVQARTTFVEFIHNETRDEIRVFSETGCQTADVVIGAFGLDEAMLGVFEKVIPGKRKYKRPRNTFRTYVTQVSASRSFIKETLGDVIHAFIPSKIPNIEFGAIVPKGEYILINTAGKNVTSPDMDSFLRLHQVKKLLPKNFVSDGLNIYQGKFPTSAASNPFGDRYAFLGDTTGWMRPFKGKGINTAIITGVKCAETIISDGFSEKSFRRYERECFSLREDYVIGNLVRSFTHYASKYGLLDFIVELAGKDDAIKMGLLNSVSGHKNYINIINDVINLQTIKEVIGFSFGRLLRKNRVSSP